MRLSEKAKLPILLLCFVLTVAVLILTKTSSDVGTVTDIASSPIKITIPVHWVEVDRECMACHVGYKITVVGPQSFDRWYIVDAHGERQKEKIELIGKTEWEWGPISAGVWAEQ